MLHGGKQGGLVTLDLSLWGGAGGLNHQSRTPHHLDTALPRWMTHKWKPWGPVHYTAIENGCTTPCIMPNDTCKHTTMGWPVKRYLHWSTWISQSVIFKTPLRLQWWALASDGWVMYLQLSSLCIFLHLWPGWCHCTSPHIQRGNCQSNHSATWQSQTGFPSVAEKKRKGCPRHMVLKGMLDSTSGHDNFSRYLLSDPSPPQFYRPLSQQWYSSGSPHLRGTPSRPDWRHSRLTIQQNIRSNIQSFD